MTLSEEGHISFQVFQDIVILDVADSRLFGGLCDHAAPLTVYF